MLATFSAHAQKRPRDYSGVKFDPKFDFSMPDFLYVEKFRKFYHYFMYF